MASLVSVKQQVKKVTIEKEVTTNVTLDLTLEEAKVLMIIGAKIGGNPSVSLRGVWDRIRNALRRVPELREFNHLFHPAADKDSKIGFLDNVGVDR